MDGAATRPQTECEREDAFHDHKPRRYRGRHPGIRHRLDLPFPARRDRQARPQRQRRAGARRSCRLDLGASVARRHALPRLGRAERAAVGTRMRNLARRGRAFAPGRAGPRDRRRGARSAAGNFAGHRRHRAPALRDERAAVDQRAPHAGAFGGDQPPRHRGRQAFPERGVAARLDHRPLRRRGWPHGRAAGQRTRQYRGHGPGATSRPTTARASAACACRRCACTGNWRCCAACSTGWSRG